MSSRKELGELMLVERIEVKRCFVVSEKGKEKLRKKQGTAFQEELAEIVKEVQGMSEPELDKSISWSPRREKYNKLTWHYELCSIDDLGVWFGYNNLGLPEGAGGLPADWCKGSLRDTVCRILKGQREIARLQGRAVGNIPDIVNVVDIILNGEFSKFLAPIVVPGGTWRPTPPCLQMKGDIDDGCMRAIAFVIKGHEKFKVYVGKT